MRTRKIIVAAVMALLAMSCSSRTRRSLLGKWLTPTGGSIEFKADGNATMAGPLGSKDVKYRLPDDDTIEFSTPSGMAVLQWKIASLGAQELVIKDSEGKEVRLRREKGS
jgi:hypothetical protein